MELRVSLNTKEDVERFVLIASLGLTTALSKDAISIEEAERHLYTPYSATRLENMEVSEDIIKLVKLGCELEDVESLVPEKLSASISGIHDKALELLKSVPRPVHPSKRWFDTE